MGEGTARQLSFCGGVIFGIGWLIFIESVAHFNSCLDSVDWTDACKWGPAPQNGTLTPRSVPPGPAPTPAPWSPFSPSPSPTPAPAEPHRGWQSIHGSYKWVYIPGVLAMLGLFMINTVDAKHLSNEYADMAYGASPTALRIWLMCGLLLGLGAIMQAVYLFVNLFDRYVDMHPGPGLAAIFQTICIAVASLVFWIGRASGSDDVWGMDPLL